LRQGIWQGSVFGPTSKIINNECSGEVFGNWWQSGGPENNRIKAFRYYTQYFGVPVLAEGRVLEMTFKNLLIIVFRKLLENI